MTDDLTCTCPNSMLDLQRDGEASFDLNCRVHADEIRFGLAMNDMIESYVRDIGKGEPS